MTSPSGVTWQDLQDCLGRLRVAINGNPTRDYLLARQLLLEAGAISMGLGEIATANGTSLSLLQEGLAAFDAQIESMQTYDLKKGQESGKRLMKTRLRSEGRGRRFGGGGLLYDGG